MQEHRTGERKKERSIKHHVAMLMPFPFEEPLRPRTNASSTQKRFSEGTGRDQNTPPMKKMIQENFWIGGQRSPNETPMQERSPSGARAEPERSRGLRKEHGTPKGRSEAGADARRPENYIIPRPQNLPAFLGGLMLLKLRLIRLL